MILISHRGNLNGKNSQRENEPAYIQEALNKGFEVEIDVWYNNGFFLGHDKPSYYVIPSFLQNSLLWCHAKNIEALRRLLDLGCHCFFHNQDHCVLTSKKMIWVFSGNQLIEGAIAVIPEYTNYKDEELKKCYGICSDTIQFYEKSFEGM